MQSILVVSFGTCHEDTWNKTIGKIEQEVAAAYPTHLVAVAYTSPTVRRFWAKRGRILPAPEDALEQLVSQGIQDIVVQPTHLICGKEYDKLHETLCQYKTKFRTIKMGLPLLSSTEDMQQVAQIIFTQFPKRPDTVLLLMGHGTAHQINSIYAAFDYLCKAKEREDIYVGSIDGYPRIDDLIPMLQKKGYHNILLTPLLLVAGSHVLKDMTGQDENSWQSKLQAAHFSVSTCIRGLGEYQAIRQMYLQHIKDATVL